MNMEQVYAQIRDIAKQHQVKKIVLFGSREFFEFSCQLEEELWSLLRLDLIDMSAVSVTEELNNAIERDGVILYEAV